MQPEISRQIDELGRLVIPKDLRKMYGCKPGDAVYLSCQDDGILIHSKDYWNERSEGDEE